MEGNSSVLSVLTVAAVSAQIRWNLHMFGASVKRPTGRPKQGQNPRSQPHHHHPAAHLLSWTPVKDGPSAAHQERRRSEIT